MKHSDYRDSIKNDPQYQEGLNEYKTRFALGDAILNARMDRGWSQEILAKRVGTKQANISRIEAGTANPTLDLIHRLLDALGLSICIVPAIASTAQESVFQELEEPYKSFIEGLMINQEPSPVDYDASVGEYKPVSITAGSHERCS
jgi:transcriptional regulator with XRE-family HTH domain